MAEVALVVGRADRERQGQFARARAELLVAAARPPLAHDLDPAEGAQGAYEDGRPFTLATRDHVEELVDSVGEIDVGTAGGTEEHARPRGRAGVRVTGRLGFVVGLGLDDYPADPFVSQLTADQLAGDRARITGEELRRETRPGRQGPVPHPRSEPSDRSAAASCSRSAAEDVPPAERFDSSQLPLARTS